MNSEVLLLALACGMTMLAYMIAINAHGSMRLSLSYLIATLMLAATVWGIVQYVNTNLDSQKVAELHRLEQAKMQAEQRAESQEELLRANKDRMVKLTKLNGVISAANAFSSNLLNVVLQDNSVEFEVLTGRASEVRKKIEDLKKDYESFSSADTFYTEVTGMLKDGIQSLSDAASYYKLYYLSEDSTQEQLREKILRQKARAAHDIFQKAGAKIASGS